MNILTEKNEKGDRTSGVYNVLKKTLQKQEGKANGMEMQEKIISYRSLHFAQEI